MSSGSNTLTLSTNGDKAYVCTVTFTDAAGNTASALSLTSFTVDTTAPTTTIAYSGSSPATGSTFDVSITFSESVTGFTASEVVLSSGSATLSGSGTTYTATITPASDATITINVAAGVASDAAGNTNAVASQVSVESDQPDAPSIDSTAVTSATEDTAYSYTVSTSDADDGSPNSNTVTVTCSTCPSWLSYSSSTGKLTGTPANANVGSNSVVLTASNLDANGNVIDSQTSTQSFTVTVTNVNSIGSVSLSGTTAEDQTLTATVSDPDGLTGVTITYQWQSTSTPQTASSWSDISGASSSTFQLTQSQVSKYVRVSVTYTDAQGGVESHTGMMGTTVSNVNDANTGTPTLSGTQAEDSTLTVSATPLTGNDEDGMTGSSYTYQWQRCTSNTASSCSDVSGSTSTTYLLGQADTDKFIRAAVSYVDDYSTTETVYTAFTSQIGNVNDAPSAGADQTGTVTEDASTTTASNTVGASDPDTGDTLSYSASSATGTYGTFAVTSSGVWTYTLDNSDADTTALDASDQVTETFTITVSDDATPSLSDTMDVVITITGANDAPSAGADQTGAVTEDASTSTASDTVSASDPDTGDVLSYSASAATGTYGSFAVTSSGVWTYTLDNSDADTTALDAGDTVTDTFTVTVSDNTAQDTMDIVITVTGANDAPDAGAAQTGSVTEDASTSTATGTVSATDADDSASLQYSASNSGSGTYGSIAFSGAAWTYTLNNADADTNALAAGASVSDAFTVTVTDGTASDTMTVTIAITGANDAPSFTTAGVTSATEDTAYSYTAQASDVDTGDTATVAVTSSTCPSWATCSGATISGTPGNSDIGSYAVDITATDGTATTTQSFTIVVAPTNDAPTIDSTAITSATEDAVYTYTLVASDVDGDTLTMGSTDVPSWLTFTAATGVLTGTPLNANVGTSGNDVTLTVTDGQVTVTQTFTITVANTNDAPTIDSTAVTTVAEDALYTYTVVASDVDANDGMTLSVTSTLPTWLSFDATTGVLSGTPLNAHVGTQAVTVQAEDTAGATATQTFTITISNTNDAPTITSTAPTSVDEDSAYSYTVQTSDVDVGDSVSLTGTTIPSWMAFDAETGVLSGTPSNSDVGSHSVTITAEDDAGATATDTFSITVANTNDAPSRH